MFLHTEDLKEVRIFRSRVIRITEHKIECPVHLRNEIATVINETVSVQTGEKTFFEVDRDILPIVSYLSKSGIEIKDEPFVGKRNFAFEELERLVYLLRKI